MVDDECRHRKSKAAYNISTYRGLWRNKDYVFGRYDRFMLDTDVGYMYLVPEVFLRSNYPPRPPSLSLPFSCNTWDSYTWTIRPSKQDLLVYVVHEHPREKNRYCCGTCTSTKVLVLLSYLYDILETLAERWIFNLLTQTIRWIYYNNWMSWYFW